MIDIFFLHAVILLLNVYKIKKTVPNLRHKIFAVVSMKIKSFNLFGIYESIWRQFYGRMAYKKKYNFCEELNFFFKLAIKPTSRCCAVILCGVLVAIEIDFAINWIDLLKNNNNKKITYTQSVKLGINVCMDAGLLMYKQMNQFIRRLIYHEW